MKWNTGCYYKRGILLLLPYKGISYMHEFRTVAAKGITEIEKEESPPLLGNDGIF